MEGCIYMLHVKRSKTATRNNKNKKVKIFPYMLIQYPSPRINMNKYVYIIPLYVIQYE